MKPSDESTSQAANRSWRPADPVPRLFWTLEQTAERLGFSVRTFFDLRDKHPVYAPDGMCKLLISKLREPPMTLVLDNLTSSLVSESLASAITAGTWSARLLGTNDMITVPVKTTFVATGVNVEVRGDMSRRCVWIRLDPKVEAPWERVFEFDPETYAREHRNELVTALLTLVRHWLIMGAPKWTGKPFGSFESWTATVGGILQAAGVECFLENRNVADDAANRERDALAAFYEGWRKVYEGEWKRSADIADTLSDLRKQSPEGKTLRGCLPEELLPIVDQREGRAATRTSAVLRKFKDRVAGGFKLASRTDPHDKVTRWAVVPVGIEIGGISENLLAEADMV